MSQSESFVQSQQLDHLIDGDETTKGIFYYRLSARSLRLAQNGPKFFTFARDKQVCAVCLSQ